ncbi:MAG: hypothetical protein IJM87_09135 [Ruminococcus sp.]|nr:hypothetical protein [Ruminococcus sp.]
MKVTKIKNYIVICLFLIFVFGFCFFGILQKDRDFSEMENRTLQKFPEVSYERIKNGEFTKEFETYMSDQVFLKDELVSVKTVTDLAFLKTKQNDVYFGSDGFYLKEFRQNNEQLDKNVGYINTFADKLPKDVSVSFLLAPNAVSVLEDKLPLINDTDDQAEAAKRIEDSLSDKVSFVCPLDEFCKRSDKDELYYHTDHHWTTKGAELGFDALMERMGESVPGADFTIEKLADFYGTMYSQAPYALAESDTIVLPTQNDNEITVSYEEPQGDHTAPKACKETDGVPAKSGLFADELREVKDKYATFMGGNFTRLRINSEGAEKDESVLIVKDSYCNSMMPYFCTKYKDITVCDLRYFGMNTEAVSRLVEERGIKKVILVYNIDFINSDNSFVWLE